MPEPSVPYALLGSVTLVLVAGWLGLAAAALVVRRRAGREAGLAPAALAVSGAVVLAVCDVVTAQRFGRPVSDTLAVARAGGALLLAGGLFAGAFSRQPRPLPVPTGTAIVVPLAAAPVPAALAGGAAALAAVAAVLTCTRSLGRVLGAALLVIGGSWAVGAWAEGSSAVATGAVLARGAGAVLLLVAIGLLARASLLAKVVSATLAGVLATAVVAVGVVGTVVVSSFREQAAALVEQAAQGRLQSITATGEVASGVASLADQVYARAPDAQAAATQVGGLITLDTFAPRVANFAAVVSPSGGVVPLGGRAPLTTAEQLAIGQDEAVRFVLMATGADALRQPTPFVVRLVGAQPTIAVVVLVPGPRANSASRPSRVLLYGVRLDDSYAAADFDAGGYGLSLLVGDTVTASNRSANDDARLERIARDNGVDRGVPEGGLTVPAEGASPTVRFVPVTGFQSEPVAVLALSRAAAESLAAQRDALRVLLLTSIGAALVVSVLSVLLGRRTVDPVRRLTAAAERIGAGDLSAAAGSGVSAGSDEVGRLARTFDAMGASLAALTGELRATAERLSTVVESVNDGLVAVDGDGTVTGLNRAAVQMAGLPDEAAAVGRHVLEVLDVRGPQGEQYAEVARRPVELPAEVHPLDGGPPVAVRVTVTSLASGEGAVVVLRDTTREREVERMKTEFLSNVSHELRTPLTPIRGYADILVTRGDTLRPEQTASFAQTILTESLKMNRVVDLLVDVAAIEAGRIRVSPVDVAAKVVLDERLAAWREKAPERAGDLSRKVATRLPLLHVDPTWLAKALDELLDNAVKYTTTGTPVALLASASPLDGHVRLAVRDRGPGIPEEAVESMFVSFEQVDGSATRRVGGLGLGLSFVQRIAEVTGLQVGVSSAVGRGAEFWVDVPTAP